MISRWQIGLVLLLATSCQPDRHGALSAQPFEIDERTALVELDGGDLVAIDPTNAAVLWWYRSLEPELRNRGPFEPNERYKLRCAPDQTPQGDIILRYYNHVVLLNSNGEKKWSRPSSMGWSRGLVACPAATPDSGLVYFPTAGFLLKLSRDNEDLWVFNLPWAGIPVASPLVMTNGDILVRTDRRLLNINPKGLLNWQAHIDLGQLDPPAD